LGCSRFKYNNNIKSKDKKDVDTDAHSVLTHPFTTVKTSSVNEFVRY